MPKSGPDFAARIRWSFCPAGGGFEIGRSREWEHPRALSGIPSLGTPPRFTDETRLYKPVAKRAIHGNHRERGHYRRAFILVGQS